MLGVTINEVDYNIKTDHKDFTIQDAINIRIRLDSIPRKLHALYGNLVVKRDAKNKAELEAKKKEIIDGVTPREDRKTFPAFYGDIIELSSDIPPEVMKLMPADWRVSLYQSQCIQNVIELLWAPMSADLVPSFVYDKVKYIAPSHYEILGEKRPMGKSRVIEFAESADLELFGVDMKGGKYSVLPNIISILYRPEGEEYNEEVCLQRAKKFAGLDMELGWGVFFYLNELANLSLESTQILRAQEQICELKKRLLKVGSINSDGTGTL